MSTSPRFLALDVFRGMTVCFMIIVNNPGSWANLFAPLAHAKWHGFTPTDLVFPAFLFAVGNALSFVEKKWSGWPTGKVVWKILKRTFIIFLLGWLLYWFPFVEKDDAGNWIMAPLSETRIFGVLQRIALCYGIAALMVYFLKPKTVMIVTVLILVLYGPVLWLTGDMPDPLSLQGNAILKLDRWLIGENHMYRGEGIAFDPEGFLSTFPAVANVIGGYFVGKFIQANGKNYETLAKLLLAGFGLIAIAYLWDYSFPVNKKLWTSTFAVYTVGLSTLIIATILFIIDFLHKTRWTYFFDVFGKNPLGIYIFSGLLANVLFMIKIGDRSLYGWLYNEVFSNIGPKTGSLLLAIVVMMVCWLLGYWLDRKKIYLRV